MPEYFTLASANERIDEVRDVLLLLRSQRREVIALNRRYRELAAEDAEEAQLLRLRIRGIVDQMSAAVSQLDGWGITLRDIRSGLIDFPTLVAGEPAWLCWRVEDGERIAWWHALDSGVAGRRPIDELP